MSESGIGGVTETGGAWARYVGTTHFVAQGFSPAMSALAPLLWRKASAVRTDSQSVHSSSSSSKTSSSGARLNTASFVTRPDAPAVPSAPSTHL